MVIIREGGADLKIRRDIKGRGTELYTDQTNASTMGKTMRTLYQKNVS